MIKIIPLLLALTATASRGGVTPIGGGITPIYSRPSMEAISGVKHSADPFSRSSSQSSSSSKESSSVSSSFSIKSSSSSSVFSSSSKSSNSSSSSSSSQHSSSSSSSSGSSPAIDPNGDYFYTEKYGPFSNPTNNEQFTFTYELRSIESQTLIERFRTFKNGSVVASSSKSSFSYTKGTRKSVTFPFYAKDYLDNNGVEIRFEILDSSHQILKSYNASIYPPSKSTIQASVLKQGVYTSKPLGFYGNGVEMVEIKDVFDFTSFGDYVDNDYYYRLDIGRNAFYFSNDYQIRYKLATFRFIDDEYAFPLYPHQANDEIVIPLTLAIRNNRLSFSFVNSFYVNKRTLEISSQYYPNFIVTKSLYLPINGLDKLKGKTIYLDIQELGMDKISTSIPLRYELNRLLIGSCVDGEYCVQGGTL